nr:unnamed protein product [Callosobruchus chinensis]
MASTSQTYCSTGNNELVQWTIPKYGGDGLKDFVEKDWKIPSEHLVCTTTHDGQLICYRIDGEEAEVEKLATYLTCISATWATQTSATVSEISRDVQISSSSLTRCSEKARSESLRSDTQQVLDMAGTKQATIKDSAAAQSAPQTSTEMTPRANVDEKKRLDKGIPKLQDRVALSLFAKKL